MFSKRFEITKLYQYIKMQTNIYLQRCIQYGTQMCNIVGKQFNLNK